MKKLAILIALAIVTAGCGSSDTQSQGAKASPSSSSAPASSTSTTTPDTSTTTEVVQLEMAASPDLSALETRVANIEASVKNLTSWIDVLKKIQSDVKTLQSEVDGKQFYGGDFRSRIDNIGYCAGRLIKWVQNFQTSNGTFDRSDNITNSMTCYDVAQ